MRYRGILACVFVFDFVLRENIHLPASSELLKSLQIPYFVIYSEISTPMVIVLVSYKEVSANTMGSLVDFPCFIYM